MVPGEGVQLICLASGREACSQVDTEGISGVVLKACMVRWRADTEVTFPSPGKELERRSGLAAEVFRARLGA